MDKHALHPYLQTIMGNVAPPAEGTDPMVEPEPELAPPNSQPGDGNGVDQDLGGQLPPEHELAAAMGGGAPTPSNSEAPTPQDDPMAAAGAPPQPEMAPEDAPIPGMPDPNDPLRNTKDEGLLAANELEIIELLQKILSSKYALMIMYYHYGATMLTQARDGIYEHLKIHAKEERESAYLVAKKIVAMGGQAAPKVGTVRPVADAPAMLQELLKAEQKIQRLWSELNLAAGQNLGLQSLAQSQCEIDMQHADDLRRWARCA